MEAWAIIVSFIVSGLVYIVVGGFAWAMTPDRWKDRPPQDAPLADLTAVFWPLVAIGWLVWFAGTIGPRVIRRQRQRNRIPRAEVVK